MRRARPGRASSFTEKKHTWAGGSSSGRSTALQPNTPASRCADDRVRLHTPATTYPRRCRAHDKRVARLPAPTKTHVIGAEGAVPVVIPMC